MRAASTRDRHSRRRLRTNEHRVRFPLWLKLGGVFGVIIALVMAALLTFDMHEDLTTQAEQRERRLVGLAEASARLLDGDLLHTFVRTPDMAREEYTQLRETLRFIRHANHVRWTGIYGHRRGRYQYIVDAEDEDPLPLNYPVFDVPPGLRGAFGGKAGFDAGNEDEWGRWDSAHAPVLDSAGAVAGVLTIDMDADWKNLMRRRRIKQGVLWILASALAILLTSILFARSLVGHLKRLMAAANAVAIGDLDQTIDIEVKDEVGVVARTFDRMRIGLKERDAIREAFGRYVDPEMARRILANPEAMRPGGELRTLTVMMSDLRGFTSLSERQTPAQMVELLNAYLGRMADVIARHQGTVNEFIGDAILALFGAPVAGEEDALRAVACAADMQIELRRFNAEHPEVRDLQMGIGLNTGPAIVGNIGSDKHLKYGVVGDAVNLAARVESFTVGGEVLLSASTYEEVVELVDVRGPITVKAKGKKEPLRLFSLLAVGAPYDLRVPLVDLGDTLGDVDIDVDCYPVRGKEVAEVPLAATLVRLGTDDAEMVVERPLAPHDNVKLRIRPDGDASLDDVYAKVTRADEEDGRHVCRLRFTSVPDPDRLESLTPPPPPPEPD